MFLCFVDVWVFICSFHLCALFYLLFWLCCCVFICFLSFIYFYVFDLCVLVFICLLVLKFGFYLLYLCYVCSLRFIYV